MQRLFICCAVLFMVSCKSKKQEEPQPDNWILSSKKIYTDKLNAFGLPDTTYTKTYTYESLNPKDSNETFVANKYDGERRLILKSYFGVRKDSTPLPELQQKYIYSKKNLVNAVDEINGTLLKDEKYTYDTSGKLTRSTIVRMKNMDKLFNNGDGRNLTKETLLSQGYDTLHITYQYDADKKNIGGEFVDNRGNLIRRDVNIYSGNTPLFTYNLGPNGDTLQRISYQQKGNQITSQSENNDFIVLTAMNSGFLVAKVTVNKKKNEKLKQEWGYVQGRITEEREYKNEGSNNKH